MAFTIQHSWVSKFSTMTTLQATRAPRKKPVGTQVKHNNHEPINQLDREDYGYGGEHDDESYSSYSSDSSSRMDTSALWNDFGDDDDDDYQPQQSIKNNDKSSFVSKNHFFSQKSIHDPTFLQNTKIFDLLCQGIQIQQPSKIQALAWPVILAGHHAIVADQT